MTPIIKTNSPFYQIDNRSLRLAINQRTVRCGWRSSFSQKISMNCRLKESFQVKLIQSYRMSFTFYEWIQWLNRRKRRETSSTHPICLYLLLLWRDLLSRPWRLAVLQISKLNESEQWQAWYSSSFWVFLDHLDKSLRSDRQSKTRHVLSFHFSQCTTSTIDRSRQSFASVLLTSSDQWLKGWKDRRSPQSLICFWLH